MQSRSEDDDNTVYTSHIMDQINKQVMLLNVSCKAQHSTALNIMMHQHTVDEIRCNISKQKQRSSEISSSLLSSTAVAIYQW